MTDLDPTTRAALTAAYWKLREHASSYRSAAPVRKVYERWENSGRKDQQLGRVVTVHEWFARGVEAAARDIAEMLGTPEHEIEPEPTP